MCSICTKTARYKLVLLETQTNLDRITDEQIRRLFFFSNSFSSFRAAYNRRRLTFFISLLYRNV